MQPGVKSSSALVCVCVCERGASVCASVCGHERATACVCRRQIVSNMSNLREIEKPKPSAVKGFLAAIDKFNGVSSPAGGKEGRETPKEGMGELKVNSGALFLFYLWQSLKLCQVFTASFPNFFLHTTAK